MTHPLIDIDALSKTERSILMYAETCCVDYGGLLEGRRMNKDDFTALRRFSDAGLLSHGRIPFHTAEKLCHPNASRHPTHWVSFSDAAWQLAHALRRRRAAQPNNIRQLVDAALEARR